MKRFYKFLTPMLMTLALAIPCSSRAQVSLTVADGTSTNGYVPVYGFYADAYLRADFVYPLTMLADMTGGIISQMTFFATQSSVSWGAASYKVYLAEVESATLTGFSSVTDMSLVYTGPLSISGNQMTITFDSSYIYGGGNLLVRIDNTVAGSYVASSWYGITSTGSSYQGYSYSSLTAISASARNFLPKVQFSYAPGDEDFCPSVSGLTTRNLASNAVTLGWSVSSIFTNVSSFTVEYGPHGFDLGTGSSWTTTNDSINLTSLTSGTHYEAYVWTNCTSGASDTTMVTFFTPAEPYANMPYSTGFEEDDDIAWAFNNGTNGWYIDTAAKFSGNYGLYISGDGGQTNNYVLTTLSDSYAARNFVLDSGTYALGFDWRCMGEGSATNIWDYMQTYLAPGGTDFAASPINTAGWTQLTPKRNNSADWQSAALQFTVSTPGTYYLVFHWHNDATQGEPPAAAIDNVDLRLLTCNVPSGLAVTQTGTTSATLAWHPGGSETAWAVSINGGDWHTVTDTTLTIDTLTDNTHYNFHVVAICSPGDTSLSVSANTTTLEYCYSMTDITANSIGFSSAGFSWTPSDNGDPATAVTVTLTCSDTSVAVPAPRTVTGTSVLFSGLQPGTTYTASFATACGDHTASVTPTLTFTTSTCGEFIGSASSSYVPFYGLYDFGYSQTLYDATVVSAIDTITGISYEVLNSTTETKTVDIYMGYTTLTALSTSNYEPDSNLTLVASNRVLDVTNTGWVTINFDTPFITAGGRGKLIVAVVNKSGSWSSGLSWAVDNATPGSSVYWYRDGTPINISDPSDDDPSSSESNIIPNTRFVGNCDLGGCMASNLAIVGTTTTSVDLSWVANGSENEWMIGYRETGGVWYYEPFTVTNTSYTVNGLNPGTNYEFALGSLCEDDTLWSTISGYTQCVSINVPMTENFDDGISPCWKSNGTSTYVTSSTGDTYVYFGGSSSYLKTPVISASVDTLQVRAFLRASYAGQQFRVGVADEDGNDVQWLDSIAASSSDYSEEILFIHNYSESVTTNRRIVLAPAQGVSYYSLTSVTIEPLISCLPIRNLHVVDTATTGTSITLDWNDLQIPVGWNIEYGPEGFTPGTGTTVTVTSHPATITDLASSTSYQFYVASACAGGSGTPVGPVTAITPFVACEDAEYVNIGSETSSGSSYFYPINAYYNYSFSETIIDSAELGGPKNIVYIAFYFNHSLPITVKNNVQIYIQPTNKSVFSSSSDYEALSSDAVQVYSGSLNCQQGWNYYALTTPFIYDGSTNLMIIVDDNSGAYNSVSHTFKVQSCSGNKTLYYYSDGINPDINNLGAYSGTKGIAQSRAVMQLIDCGEIPVCQTPVLVDVAVAETAATVTFVGDADNYEAVIVEGAWSDSAAAAAVTVAVPGIADTLSYTFSGLTASTSYTIGVRAVCATDFNSDWATQTITTVEHPCYTPTNLTATDVTFNTATLSWTLGETESQWVVSLTNVVNNDDTLFVVNTNPVGLTGLIPHTSYVAKIKAVCSDIQLSDWSEAIAFTTVTCQSVAEPTVSNITSHSVDITWNTGSNSNGSYQIEYGICGVSHGSGIRIDVSDTTYTLDSLLEGTAYDVYVRSVCATGVYSNWSPVAEFNTLGDTLDECSTPTDVTVSDISLTSATISWTETGSATAWTIDYNGQTVDVATNPYTLTGLTHSTTYTVAVRAICSEELQSEYSAPATFSTTHAGIDDVNGSVVTLYPNPATVSVTLSGIKGLATITIIDLNGRESGKWSVESGEITIDVSDMAKGAYFVRITDEQNTVIRKLVIR